MSKEIKDLENLFENFSDMSPENMDGMVKQSIKALEQILHKLGSDDEEQRQEAQEMAEQLRETLEGQAKNALKELNMDEGSLQGRVHQTSDQAGPQPLDEG